MTEASKEFLNTNQPKIFLSYSHRDRRWVDRLLTHLRVIADNVTVWSDAQIEAGASWEDEIGRAINAADIAILLIRTSKWEDGYHDSASRDADSF